MHHFFEAITNTSGESLIGYFARVIDPATQGTVALAADDSGTPIVTVSGVADMAKSDDYGNLSLYVEPGTYHLDIYAADATTFVYRVPNVAMNSSKGDKGDRGDVGDAGPAFATFTSLASFKAAPITNATQVLQASSIPFGQFNWETANAPYTADDLNVIKADSTALSIGAWVRQKADGVSYRRPDSSDAVIEDIASIFGETVRIKAFGAKFDVGTAANIGAATDDTAAWTKALSYLASRGGGTLQLPEGASKVTAQIDIPVNVPIRIIGTGARKVYPGAFTVGTKCPSTVVPVHADRNAFRFIGTAAGQGAFCGENFNIATLETGSMPTAAFGWETQGGFLYGFTFRQMGIYGLTSAFDQYKTGGTESAAGAVLIDNCTINRNSWIARSLNGTQFNGFRFLHNKAGQNGYLPGTGGLSISGHDVAINDNVLESNRDAVFVFGAYADVEVKGNYFEGNVGRACIELRDIIGAYNVGPNNFAMSFPYAGAGEDETTTARLAHKVLLNSCELGQCTDPYWSAGVHKSSLPLTGTTTKQNLNTNVDYLFFRVDRLAGASYCAAPQSLATVGQLPGAIVREINPQTGTAMPTQEYTTTGTGIVSLTYTIAGSTGQWVVLCWLLKRLPDAGAVVDPYITLLVNGTTPRKDFPISKYDHCWNDGEWSLVTVAFKLTATMSTLTAQLYPHGMSPAAGRVSRFLRPYIYTVDDINKAVPFISTQLAQTSSAAPTTGTWVTGDTLIKGSGGLLICTASGTPGTWGTVTPV